MSRKGLGIKLFSAAVSSTSAVAHVKYRTQVHNYQLSLQEKLADTLSTGMILKVAESGLSYRHLLLACQRSGADGLHFILTELVHRKPRVTKTKRILDQIPRHFMARSK